jgi:hypothetical protein
MQEVQVLRLGAAERTAARAWELKTKATAKWWPEWKNYIEIY